MTGGDGRGRGWRPEVTAGLAGAAGLAWAAAWVIERQRRLLAQLGEAQARLADEAAAGERARIAREVHDVIAHSLTVTLLHLASARLALAERPAEAAAALGEAERLARQSLNEIRRTVGLLARAGEREGLAPLPGAADLDRLVADYRAGGVAVALRVSGDPGRLAPATGLAVYRIVEEAVANAARHAPGAAVTVDVEAGPDRTSVRVLNGPSARSAQERDGGLGSPGGLGLSGMRERAMLLGGRLRSGPSGGGWAVEAELPGTDVDVAGQPS